MDKEEIIIIAIVIGVMFAMIGGAGVMTYYSCANRWQDSGLVAEYRYSSRACIVTLKNGTKVPESSIRNVDIK